MQRLISGGSPFELIDAVVGGITYKIFKHAPRTLADLYTRTAHFGSKDFLVWHGKRLTYREVFQRANELAMELSESFEVSVETRVALILDDTPDWVIAFIAVTSLGATLVPVPSQSCVTSLMAMVEMTDCRVVICDALVADHWQGKRRDLQILVAEHSIVRRPDLKGKHLCIPIQFIADDALRGSEVQAASERLALIAFTSGSTGSPKGVEVTHSSIICGLMNMLLGAALMSRERDAFRRTLGRTTPVSLVLAPFSYISGYSNLLLAIYLGGTIAVSASRDVESVLQLLETESVTSVVGATPELIGQLLRSGRARQAVTALRTIVAHGTAFHHKLSEGVEALVPGASIGSGYGMTETNGSVCVASSASLRERPGASGRPLPTVALRIARNDGGEADVGEIGEIWLRGAMLMRGYCQRPELTREVLQGGWFRTGDCGYVDGDGFLYVGNRTSEVAVGNGAHVSLYTIERAVLDNNLATEAVAICIASETLGERVALVVAPGNAPTADRAKIAALLISLGLDDAALPQIISLPSLPRTASGKVDRTLLRGELARIGELRDR